MEIGKAAAMIVLGGVFVIAMHKNWELTSLCFGIATLLGTCTVLEIN